MGTVAVIRRFRNLLDVSFGTPSTRHAPMYDGTNLVMRAITSADISDATDAATPSMIVGRDASGGASFTSIGVVSGTKTTSSPFLTASQTWNAAGVVFTGISIAITSLASQSSSKVFEVLIGGVTKLAQYATGAISCPDVGTNSERFGYLSAATGSNGLAVGWNSSASHSGCVMVGSGVQSSAVDATAIGTNAVAGVYSVGIGNSVVATGTGVAIGKTATQSANSSVAIGYQSNVSSGETSSVSLGHQASCDGSVTGGGEAVAVGGNAYSTSWRGTAVGYKAKVNAVSGTAIGRGAYASHPHAIAIGRGSFTNASNQVCIGFGGSTGDIDYFFENGHTHKYVAYPDGETVTLSPSTTNIVLHGMDAYDSTASPTNNVAGGTLKLAAGRGTGTAAGGSVILQVAPAGGSSNNTKNTLVNGLEVDTNKNVVLGTAAIATNATDGFLYIATCAGAPSGTPTAKTGRVAVVYDSSNNKLYVYNGAWKSITLA